jgi:hypothetical protein
VDVKFPDEAAFFANLNDICDRRTRDAAGKALMVEATDVWNKSQMLCPKDTGNLAGSAEPGPVWVNDEGRPEVAIVYRAPYALHVHEKLNAEYSPVTQEKRQLQGRQDHYLSIPLQNARAGFLERVGARFWNFLWAAATK